MTRLEYTERLICSMIGAMIEAAPLIEGADKAFIEKHVKVCRVAEKMFLTMEIAGLGLSSDPRIELDKGPYIPPGTN